MIKFTLKNHYINFWRERLLSDQKLRTYKKFKTEFGYENYLDNLNIYARQTFARLRISAHTLPIESDRYKRNPSIPSDKRFCLECPDQVGDEIHFLTECKAFNEDREILFEKVTEEYHNFVNLSKENKMIFLLSSEGNLQKSVAEFIRKNLK